MFLLQTSMIVQKLNEIDKKIDENTEDVIFHFCQNNIILDNSPICGMTLKKAGSMRFRWNEENLNRTNMLTKLSGGKIIVPLELIHSHTVYDIKNGKETVQKQGDGLITQNNSFMLTVTVADCMPIFLYNPKNNVFGIVHSGWKGTGIVESAISMAIKQYGGNVKDFCVILGPHIRDCCYIVDEQRANYFIKEFSKECVEPFDSNVKMAWNNLDGKKYRLSLEKANLCCLKKLGVSDKNIVIINECTCCNSLFGSNRRETILVAEKTGQDFSQKIKNPDFTPPFTVQAAYIKANA